MNKILLGFASKFHPKRKARRQFKFALLEAQYAHHSFSKAFDWDWSKIHFNRIALVNLLVSKFNNCAYLEIGCNINVLFDAVPCIDKVGVDPVVGGNVRQTSDAFFQENSKQFDVIFIDGLHTYEQVHKDVVNAMKSLKPGGWIALDDLLPRTWIEHHVPSISQGAWTGDIWKTAFELANTPGIDFKILKIDNGVGVFRMTDPNAELVDLSSELADKQFDHFYNNIHHLPIVEWEQAQFWLKQ